MIAHFEEGSLTFAEAVLYLCASVGAAVLFSVTFIALVLGGLLLWDKVSYRRSGRLLPRQRSDRSFSERT